MSLLRDHTFLSAGIQPPGAGVPQLPRGCYRTPGRPERWRQTSDSHHDATTRAAEIPARGLEGFNGVPGRGRVAAFSADRSPNGGAGQSLAAGGFPDKVDPTL